MPRENNPNFLLKARKLPAKSSDLFFSQPSIQELALPLAKPVLATIPLAEFHCETGSVEPVEAGNAKSGQWRAEDQTRLYQLHNQLGNKWSQMAKSFPGKSDNCVKNHFFSRLRMSLRHINKQLPSHATTRPAKMHVIYKIASTCEERFNPESEYTSAFISFAYQLKNKILGFLGENRHSLEYVQQTLEEVHLFNKQFKMRDEILKVPKVARVKATKERHSQDDEEKADQEFVGEPSLTWMQSGLVEGPSSKVQTWTTLQTILQQSSRLSQLLRSEPERMQIRMVQTSEYLFNDQNMSINDWMDAINNDPTFAPACF